MEALDLLVKRWQSEDLNLLPPYGEAVVRATFLAAGMEPAKDLVELYCATGGMEVADRYLWRLWPLSEVDERNDAVNDFGILFSDYLLDSWAYRVRSNDETTSAVYIDYYDGRQPILVAATLARFFERYLEDADALLTEVE